VFDELKRITSQFTVIDVHPKLEL